MDIRSQSSVAALSTGTTSSTPESGGEASEHWSMRWSPRTTGELSSLERFELLGWDEV
jgi:hypothetical protein